MNAKVKKLKSTLPVGELEVRDEVRNAKTRERLPVETVRLMLHGWEIRRQIETLEAALKEVNAKLIEQYGAPVALIIPEHCRASIAAREAVKIKDDGRLRAVLGDRFDDLVRTRVTYTAEPKLAQMACDADEPLSPAIRACLTMSGGKSVTWRAEG